MQNHVKTKKCIYCYHDKHPNAFNKEHVVPRFMGRYENAFTLHKKEVCRECNTYFDKTFETELSQDSLEAFLRMSKFGMTKQLKDAKDTRLNILCSSGIHKGLKFKVILKNNKLDYIPYPSIGLKLNDNENYQYYTPENLPYNTEEISSQITGRDANLCFWNIDEESVKEIVFQKGYSYLGGSVLTILPQIRVSIKAEIDSLVKRMMAKTIFNYVTYKYGKNYTLLPQFNEMRFFIRYGQYADAIEFTTLPNHTISYLNQYNNAHIVGLVYDEGNNSLNGLVSWFNTIIYTIALGKISKERCKLPMSVFDNEHHRIIDAPEEYYIL